jgi:hypothetical protein
LGVAKATPSFQKDLPLLITMFTKITLSKWYWENISIYLTNHIWILNFIWGTLSRHNLSNWSQKHSYKILSIRSQIFILGDSLRDGEFSLTIFEVVKRAYLLMRNCGVETRHEVDTILVTQTLILLNNILDCWPVRHTSWIDCNI